MLPESQSKDLAWLDSIIGSQISKRQYRADMGSNDSILKRHLRLVLILVAEQSANHIHIIYIDPMSGQIINIGFYQLVLLHCFRLNWISIPILNALHTRDILETSRLVRKCTHVCDTLRNTSCHDYLERVLQYVTHYILGIYSRRHV